ncbi:MAG: PKD domain-containing protein [Candidatus Paceibacterota bacterium]
MKKILFVGFLSAFVFAVSPTAVPSASAETAVLPNVSSISTMSDTQLVALLTQLIQIVQQLQTQITAQNGGQSGGVSIGGDSSTPTSFCYNFDRNLTIGNSGPAVNALKQVLFKEGVLDKNQSSSAGSETFTETLASAVTNLQEKYSSEVLAPSNLSHGTGFVGPSTRAKLNKLYGCNGNTNPPTIYSCQTDNDCKEMVCVGGGFAHEQCVNNKCYISDEVKNKCGNGTAVACTTDAKQCPDGSYVGRVAPSCNFKECPESIKNRITVLSPNGGEAWQTGTTQTIKWQDNRPMPTCTTSVTSTGAVAVPMCVNEFRAYDIQLATYYQPCTGQVCPMVAMVRAPYIIAKTVTGNSYNWNVGTAIDTANISAGSYKIMVCQNGTENCDSSDSYFKIYSGTSTNLPPVINGLTAPTTLTVNQTGTWTVNASDPENGALSYSVSWGDNSAYAQNSTSGSAVTSSSVQNSTFTHSYSSAGTYTVTFTVKDNAGLSAQTSATVQVVGQVQTNSSPKIVGLPAIPANIQTGQTVSISLSATDSDKDDLAWSVEWGDSGVATACSSVRRQTGTGWNFNSSHAWSQPGTYQVKVTVSDCVGGSDSYSFNVTVVNATNPSVTVLSPNGGEMWQSGTNQTITWKDSDVNPLPCPADSTCTTSDVGTAKVYDINLVSKGCSYPLTCAIQPKLIAQSVSGNSFLWQAGKLADNTSISGDYKISVCRTGTSYCDQSDSYFTITTPQAKTSPCGNSGDVDSDGYLTNNDITIIRQAILGLGTLTSDQKTRADVNNDGNVTSLDITYINGYLIGTQTTFPVCLTNNQ